MEVGIRVFRHVIVEDNVDSLDVHPPTKEIRSHQDTLAEALKCLVLGKPAKNKKTSKITFFRRKQISM